jgi:hypothetical protein
MSCRNGSGDGSQIAKLLDLQASQKVKAQQKTLFTKCLDSKCMV